MSDRIDHFLKTRQRGVTLVELMISLALGLLVVAAATALLLSTKAGYSTQDESSHIQDTGNFAAESISRALRQAAYVDWRQDDSPIFSSAAATPNVVGYDASRVTGDQTDTPRLTPPLTDGVVNGSDVLAVLFFGSGTGKNGDGTILDCGGMGIPAAASQAVADEARGMSIFYVAKSGSGEPELYCRWHGETKWESQSIARGIESFQVLYGVDTDGDSLPNRFVTATAIRAMDDALGLQGAAAAEKSSWRKVVAVKIALLVRGSQPARSDTMTAVYDLFGKEYGDAYSTTDVGTRVTESSLSQSIRNRIRKVFTTTIQLRNQSAGGV